MGAGANHRNKHRPVDGRCIIPAAPFRVKGPMGKGAETAYMGYDSNNKMYTYDSFNSLGEAEDAKVNVGRRHLDLAQRDKNWPTDDKRTTHH
jgi:hypothetical protein